MTNIARNEAFCRRGHQIPLKEAEATREEGHCGEKCSPAKALIFGLRPSFLRNIDSVQEARLLNVIPEGTLQKQNRLFDVNISYRSRHIRHESYFSDLHIHTAPSHTVYALSYCT